MDGEKDGVEVLSKRDCLRLLGSQRVGRVALTVNALPAVLAVSYRLVDGTVLFYTSLGKRLRASLSQTVVAFEADCLDGDTHRGWTVVAVGSVFEVSDPGQVEAAHKAGARPWGDPARAQLMCFRPEIISGRRVGSGIDDGPPDDPHKARSPGDGEAMRRHP